MTDYGRNHDADKTGMTGWRRSLAVYTDRRVLLILALGFASGLPLLLTFSTLSAWLATAGVRRAAIHDGAAGRGNSRVPVRPGAQLGGGG